MYLYAERILIQILAFSLGPFLGLLTAAFVNPWAGIIIGLTAFIFIFFQPFFSDCCLKNTAKDLGLEKILVAEGNIKYYSRSLDLKGKLYLCKDGITFVINNKVDLFIPVKKILKVQGETEQSDKEALAELISKFERRSPNLPQVTQMAAEIADLNCGRLQITVEQSIFRNEFCFEVSDIKLWVKKVNELQKSRAL